MRKSGTGAGGGIGMNKNVRPSVRTGSGSRGTHPGGVAQLGQHVGDKATHGDPKGTGYRGEPLHNDRTFQPVKFGNELALNCGPDGRGGRTNHGPSGSQRQWGTPAQGASGLPSTKGQWPDKR
jgi:hypothetical protein